MHILHKPETSAQVRTRQNHFTVLSCTWVHTSFIRVARPGNRSLDRGSHSWAKVMVRAGWTVREWDWTAGERELKLNCWAATALMSAKSLFSNKVLHWLCKYASSAEKSHASKPWWDTKWLRFLREPTRDPSYLVGLSGILHLFVLLQRECKTPQNESSFLLVWHK